MRQVLDDGQPLRDAVKATGLSLQDLADKTKGIDGYGVSRSLIGNLVSTGTSQRHRCEDRSASLIAQAVGRPEQALFAAA